MDQGAVRLVVGWAAGAGRIVSARVDCRRPQAAGVLVGRPVAEAVALAPRLFSLCGCAQGAAATLAAAAASGGQAPVSDELRLAVAREAIGEHLWRLLLDWPLLLGATAQQPAFLAWRKRLLTAGSLPDNARLGQELLDWLLGLQLPSFSDETAVATAALLPWRPAAGWATAVDAAFAEQPTLAGGPAETGSLARRHEEAAVAGLLAAGQRVAARLAARRADLEWLAGSLLEPERLDGWLDAAPLGDGTGLARVETARGLLLHLMQVKDGRVERYVIVAPTEWNFHPQGAFAGELVGRPAATREAAAMQARRLALALDPCVNYEVKVEDA